MVEGDFVSDAVIDGVLDAVLVTLGLTSDAVRVTLVRVTVEGYVPPMPTPTESCA